jgi:hypothetical protein
MSVRVNEPVTADSPPRRKRTEPYVRKAPEPQEHWRKAWGASMSLYDREGKELRTLTYGAEATTDQNALRASAARHKSFVDLVDIEHLCRDYLDKVVDACEPEGDPHHMKDWYRSELLRDDSAIDGIWTNLRRLGKRLSVERIAARAAVAAALRCIRHRKNKMGYASHYAANLPIGSGATEGTCWQMQGRVKCPGQSWGTVEGSDHVKRTPGLNGVMTTRGLVLSERWDTAWPTYAAKHRKELRPAA